MSVIDGVGSSLRNGLAWVAQLSLRNKLIAAGGVAAVVLGALWLVGGGRGCGSREDVEARVALVSSGLQQAAAEGKLAVDQLAAGVKKMNEAATAYEANKDHAAFCAALDQLSGEFAGE